MVAPRRRFPGGSVGQFFLIRPARDNGDAEQAECFLTEDEALTKATDWAQRSGDRVYIARYTNHVDPDTFDAKR